MLRTSTAQKDVLKTTTAILKVEFESLYNSPVTFKGPRKMGVS